MNFIYKKWEILSFFILNVLLAIYATPVTDFGDAISYVNFSRVFLGADIIGDYAHRSPLFSLIMAGFIRLAGEPLAFTLTIYFNYLLLFLTTYLTLLISRKLIKHNGISYLSALAFNLSFSSIYFANILFTEILTVFLLTFSFYNLVKYAETSHYKNTFLVGLFLGLLALARFNTLPIVVSFVALFCYFIFFEKKSTIKSLAINLSIILIPYLVILNLWSFYNYHFNNFYGLFPIEGTSVNRNVVVASIDSSDIVSRENEGILQIFLKARQTYYKDTTYTESKGSIASAASEDMLIDLYSGYDIYSIAFPELIQYFNLPANAGDNELNNKITDFFIEIENQNSSFIWKLRFYSALNSIRASNGGGLPDSYGNINLNFLPGFVFKIYKLIIPLISVFVFLACIFFAIQFFMKKIKPPFELIAMYVILFSFWGINFVYATGSDANRFKYPAEPLLIILFFYSLIKLYEITGMKKRNSGG